MKNNVRIICEGAIMVALAQILGYIKIFHLPQGGSVTLTMLPIMVFCIRWGLSSGLIASFALGVLQLVLDGAYTWGWQSIIFDYLLAYGILGVAGAFCKKESGIFLGTVVAGLLRLISHTISGYLFVSEMTSWELYGMQFGSPWAYSLIYNASYMIPNILIVIIVCALLRKPLKTIIAYQGK